jgi:hypothetical protein
MLRSIELISTSFVVKLRNERREPGRDVCVKRYGALITFAAVSAASAAGA